ncbi:MAG: hypothetical protein ABJQ29_05335 [Luteolibacter sp.]
MKRTDHHLIQQVLDGDVEQETFDLFQQRMREEPELLKHYEKYALLHHTLSEEFGHGNAALPATTVASNRSWRPSWVLAAAAAVALMVAVWQLLPRMSQPSVKDVAVVTFSVDAVWKIEGESRNLGAATGVSAGSKILLQQGIACVFIEPAVSVVLEGPSETIIPSANSLYLKSGRGYINRGGTGGGLMVTTPRITALGSGTEFWIESYPESPDEVHVMDGKLRVISKVGSESTELLSGDAACVSTSGLIEQIPADSRQLRRGLVRFKSVVSGTFEKDHWRVSHGNPMITESRIEGDNYSMFLPLSEQEAVANGSVMLATLDVGRSSSGEFHSEGKAGLSFFSGGDEVLFFGDSYGTGSVWSLDVKQKTPVIVPEQPVSGPRTITLRYDQRTGDVSLHEGGLPLKPAFCSGKIPPNTNFDELRIGASSGAALAVNSLLIRVSGD